MAKRIIKPDSGNILVLQEDNGSIDALTVETNGNITLAEKLIIDPAKGIDFGTSTSGSGTATGGVLDDYEEGTWACSVVGQTGTATGRYVKIGALVHVELRFLCDTNVSSTTTNNVISGLPFSASSTTRSYLHFAAQNLSAVAGANGAPTISASVGPPYFEITLTTGTVRPVSSTSGNPYYREDIFQSTSSFYLSGTYRIA